MRILTFSTRKLRAVEAWKPYPTDYLACHCHAAGACAVHCDYDQLIRETGHCDALNPAVPEQQETLNIDQRHCDYFSVYIMAPVAMETL